MQGILAHIRFNWVQSRLAYYKLETAIQDAAAKRPHCGKRVAARLWQSSKTSAWLTKSDLPVRAPCAHWLPDHVPAGQHTMQAASTHRIPAAPCSLMALHRLHHLSKIHGQPLELLDQVALMVRVVPGFCPRLAVGFCQEGPLGPHSFSLGQQRILARANLFWAGLLFRRRLGRRGRCCLCRRLCETARAGSTLGRADAGPELGSQDERQRQQA